MKTHDTIAGNYYGITSPNGCTVTDELGKLRKTVEAGDQLTVQAPGAKLIVDDDEAVIIKATFKRAALALGLLGGGVDKWGKYAKCTTNEEMAAINADYRNDVDEDGVWAWKLPNMVNFNVSYGGTYQTSGLSSATKIKHLKLNLPKATRIANCCRSLVGVIQTVEVRAPLATSAGASFYDCAAKKFTLYLPAVKKVSALLGWCAKAQELGGDFSSLEESQEPVLHNYGTIPPFTTVTCGFPSLKNGNAMFAYARLDKASSLLILSSIPAWADGATHTLTLGIHVDHQTDEDVIAAIENAEAKGWTLTVQWNGTATAQAASTWGRRKPVFARLGEPMENGTATLDWGHYVTDPSGYTEFASLEEAKEHFNITD